MSVKCQKCNSENSDTQSFCGECGASLVSPDISPEVTQTLDTNSPQLKPGDLLGGRYKVLGVLGKGGMGEVYRAEDGNLKRQIAIKVLPQPFALDKDRLTRFEREARLLASLNHYNIATIHGLEKSANQRFLVMELVKGDTLADKLKKGPLPLNKTLEICRQIAEGLEAAHEKGIIHRDLKPANIKVTSEGKVKILDFGIAKAYQKQAEVIDSVESATTSNAMTQPGVIIGTAAYMSPEQAQGKSVDKRTDIWSFGCLLYECLTGQRPFKGKTASETMASILKDEPEWDKLPEKIPLGIRRLLRRCLEKDSRKRLRDIGDAKIEIEDFEMETEVRVSRASWRKNVFPFALTAIFTALFTTFLIMILTSERESTDPSVTRSLFNLPDNQTLVAPAGLGEFQGRFPPIAISSDGKKIAFVSQSENSRSEDAPAFLYVWEFDQWQPRLLYEHAKIELPFFSPDGSHLGFLVEEELYKISVTGRPPVKISHVMFSARGAVWGADGTIILGGVNEGLQIIKEEGTDPSEITHPNKDRGEQYHAWPKILPDGKHVLFVAVTGESSDIGVLSLKTGKWRLLERTEGASKPHYLESGHLIFFRDSGLFAVPFELSNLESTGSVTPVLENVFMGWNAGHNLGFYSVSHQGSLIYVSGGLKSAGNHLVLVDRQGNEEKLPIEQGRFGNAPALSPDGKLLALGKTVRPSGDLWFWDFERERLQVLTRLNANIYPVWNKDNKHLFFSCFKKGSTSFDIFSMSLDEGEREAEPILVREFGQYPTSLSSDGRFLAFEELHPATRFDIHILHLEGDRESSPFINTSANEKQASFSPDGRFLAFVSDETGRDEVYVKSVKGTGGKIIISDEGGIWPRWSSKGNELYYLQNSKMMAAEIGLNPNFQVMGKPRQLFEGHYLQYYDVTADGQHFVMITKDQAVLTQINAILNWSVELNQEVPVEK